MNNRESGIYIPDESLAAFAENAARGIRGETPVSGRSEAARLMASLRRIRAAHDRLSRDCAGAADTPRAAEWLLDNWYLIRREGKSAARELERARRLTTSREGCVLTALCGSLQRAGRGEVTAARAETYLEGFQRARPLSQTELSLFVPALKAALIHEAAELIPDGSADELGRLVTSLRLFSTLSFTRAAERVDMTERELLRDPAGVYPLMDEKTRRHYRERVARLARQTRTPEHRVAAQVTRLSSRGEGRERHVGYFLFERPLGAVPAKREGGWYIALVVLGSVVLSLLAGFLTDSAAVALLLLLPVFELIKSITDFAALSVAPPSHVPRMALKGGVPDEGRTLCVISTLLTSEKAGPAAAGLLEEYRLANRDCGKNLLFGLLADLPDTREPETPGAAASLDAAAARLEALNEKYGGGFYLFTRERVFVKRDGRYMGRERKRGAILALCRLLAGRETELYVRAGDKSALAGARYILTLDGDTRLEPGTARELIGAMLHPMNTPVTDETRRVVSRGRGILQPRMAVSLLSVGRSDFARAYSGLGGVDPYESACGEVYMDLFGSGGFAGKGILDVGAYLACLDGRIPDGSVLSHDILEGAFLRGGFVGDVELTDGCPSTVRSYFRRMHRWVRGDWQNLPWLFGRGRALRQIDRFRVFDNLRRSLTPVGSFASIFLGFLMPQGGLGLAAAAAVTALASEIVTGVARFAFSERAERGVRYHSAVLPGLSGGLVRTALRLIFLPYEAWICLSALVTALWRMLISRRNLLAWQTAAQTDAPGGSRLFQALELWPSMLAGLASLLFSGDVIGMAAGLVWLLSPLAALAVSRERRQRREVGGEERDYLLGCAREMWRFFEETVDSASHFLPPDNLQEQPPVGKAMRTSPTNIGLFLLSAAAASDLGLVARDAAAELASRALESVSSLEKWRGHLYNWYDVETLAPLLPRYVSAVDSGNLAACLIALAPWLEESGRGESAALARALVEAMDFSPLYDEERGLFYIGVDADKNEPTSGWYDLIASEARLASFIAVARGDVPRKHWRRLSRAQLALDGYRGAASWTGTMFEYMMPELLLPLYPDSLLYESARFCLYAQKRRGGLGFPWGISESAFFSLDQSLSYRYKAHGVAAAALKRGQDEELVVSPYSTFLALPHTRGAALRNLRRLESLGARGRLGFYEAVDFTPSRTGDKGRELVRCYMAHHVGMSLISVANTLCGVSSRERFMRDPSMRAFASLLQERVPIGGVLLRQTRGELPKKPSRREGELWRQEGRDLDYVNQACCLLGNGVYSLLVTAAGMSRSAVGETLITRFSPRVSEGAMGAAVFLRLGERVISLLPLPAMDGSVDYDHEFTAFCAAIQARAAGLASRVEFSVPESETGEKRVITLQSERDLEAELLLVFEPVLMREVDYVNHLAFGKLGLSAEMREGALLLRRRARTGARERWLCLAADTPPSVCAHREKSAGRGGLGAAAAFPTQDALGPLSDPLVTASWRISLVGGRKSTLTLALAVGDSAERALASARRIQCGEGGVSGERPDGKLLLSMGARELSAAMQSVTNIVFSKVRVPITTQEEPGRQGLWRFGVSGDLPIVAMRVDEGTAVARLDELLRRHLLLSLRGLSLDLVFIVSDGGDYHRRQRTVIWERMRAAQCEYLLGAKGGIHLADAGRGVRTLIASCAEYIEDAEALALPQPYEQIMSTCAPFASRGLPPFGWAEDGSFSFDAGKALPPRSWADVLANGRFGFLAQDCGGGCMWYKNARECRVDRWVNDPLATRGPETLELETDKGRFSLFAAPDGQSCRVTYDFGLAVWERELPGVRTRVTAFVPPEVGARVLLVELEGPGADSTCVFWGVELALCADESELRYTVIDYVNHMPRAVNPRCPFPGLELYAAAAGEWSFSGPLLKLAVRGERRFAIVCGVDAPERLAALMPFEAASAELERTRTLWRSLTEAERFVTPDESLNHLLRGWALYQTVACRILGRCSVYQSGGAFGFRDQLQDVCSVIDLLPGLARAHIIRCCAHQYAEGDAQHWWHELPDGDKGVRTRCADDLLWLPWALCEYVEQTGDAALCSEKAPFLISRPLGEKERERYETPALSEDAATVFEHARRALALVAERGAGAHGLLLMGTGDWNDGMDLVGARGRGESVWLTWFFSGVCSRFAALCERLGTDGGGYEALAERFGRAADAVWDGEWYPRAFTDAGEAIGARGCAECELDSVAQSASVWSRYSDPERRRTAIKSAFSRLYDGEGSLVRLFDPPFADGGTEVGYIRSYGPGFRENGGQYTHGAVWLAMACFREGMADEGWTLLRALMPETHDALIYGAEPYVLPADVYTAEGQLGRAGWSWYTGAAGWFRRVATGDMLGLKLRDGLLYIEPCLPSRFEGYEASFLGHDIRVGPEGVFSDGVPYDGTGLRPIDKTAKIHNIFIANWT